MTDTDTVPRNGTPLKVVPPPVQTAMTDAQKRDAARAAWRDDPTLTGAELGRRHDMTESWGRKQIRAERDAPPRHGRRTAAPAYGPPAPTADAPRKLNGTTHTPVAAPVRPSKPAQRKPPAESVPEPAQALVVVSTLAVAVVAAVAAVVSYVHTRDLALAVGQNPLLASLLPFSVDGLVVVGSTSLLIDRQRRRGGQRDSSGSAWAVLAVTIGLAASLAANVVSVDPTVVDLRTVRWVMAAYAPVALALAGHLLLRMLDTDNRKDTP